MARSALPGGRPPDPPAALCGGWCSPLAFRSPLAFWVVLAVGLLLAVASSRVGPALGFLLAGLSSGGVGGGGWVTGPRSLVLVPGCAWQVGLTLAWLEFV